VLSPKDAEAPTLEQARRAGLLPVYADCEAYLDSLRRAAKAPNDEARNLLSGSRLPTQRPIRYPPSDRLAEPACPVHPVHPTRHTRAGPLLERASTVVIQATAGAPAGARRPALRPRQRRAAR
jgi:hypothetical protein